MKFTAAVLAFAAGANAAIAASNETYVTVTVDQYTTYCPEATTLTHGGQTYTITEPTTLTISDCPGGCTISKPVYSSSSVACNSCPSSAPAVPYPSSNATVATSYTSAVATSTGALPTSSSSSSTPSTSQVPTAGAEKIAALSGAGLFGLLGLAIML